MDIFEFDDDGVTRFFCAPYAVLGVPALLIFVTGLTLITLPVLASLGAIEQASLIADRAFFGAGEVGGPPGRTIATFIWIVFAAVLLPLVVAVVAIVSTLIIVEKAITLSWKAARNLVVPARQAFR